MVGIYLFFLLIAPQLWVPGLTGLPVDIILFAVWGLVLVLQGDSKKLLRFDLADKLFAAFLAWIVIGVLINGVNDASRGQLYVYLRIFALYKLVTSSLNTVEDVRWALKLFVFFSVILAFEAIDHKMSPDQIGWAGQSLGWVDPSVIEAGGTGRARWVGIFDGPGVFCVIFTVALSVCLPYLGGANRKWSSFLALVMVALLGYATYLTGSRGGFLATLAVLGLFVAVRNKVSARKILIGSALCIIAFMLAPSTLTSTRDQSRSAQHRVEMWSEGVEMTKQNPIFGIGRGNFKSYTGRLIAHNSAIEIGGETGIVGLLLWGTLIYVSMKSAIVTWKNSIEPTTANVGFGLVLAILGYLVSAMFVTLEYETFYLLIALCTVLNRQQPAVQLTKREVLTILSVTGAWLIFLQFFVIAYMS
jgi:O-antigen ligase